MGDPKAFLTIRRQEAGYRPVYERITDYSEVEQTLNTHDRKLQASRCMDCGVPFCHWACPLGNKQPEWQDALYKGKWKEAYEILAATCDFPEFTGRICPALCEKSCVLKLSCDEPVTIRENEAAIIEAAFREGYVIPVMPQRNGKQVAVIGAGPAGLAAGIYDNTRIILVSDHGESDSPMVERTYNDGKEFPDGTVFQTAPYAPGRPHALLMVKEPHQRGELRISDAFMSSADVPTLALQGVGTSDEFEMRDPAALPKPRILTHSGSNCRNTYRSTKCHPLPNRN